MAPVGYARVVNGNLTHVREAYDLLIHKGDVSFSSVVCHLSNLMTNMAFGINIDILISQLFNFEMQTGQVYYEATPLRI